MITNSDALIQLRADAYAAGLFDGEGHVEINMHRQSLKTRLRIVNTDIRPLQFCLENFGGVIAAPKSQGRKRQLYTWTVYKQESVTFAERILPHCRVKHEQLRLYIQACGLIERNAHRHLAEIDVIVRKLLVEALHNDRAQTLNDPA